MNKLFAITSVLLVFGCGKGPGLKTSAEDGIPRLPSTRNDGGLRTEDIKKLFPKTQSTSLSKCSESSLSTTLPPGETENTIARYVSGQLFDKARNSMPAVKDVIQAGFNVCYLYAFLSSYVSARPRQIKDSIKQVEDGFLVTVYDETSTKPCVFISNLQLAIFRKSGNARTTVIWPEVLAAAFVSYLRGQNMQNATDVGIENTGTNLETGKAKLLLGETIDMSLTRKDIFHYFLNETGKTRRIKPKLGYEKTPAFLTDADDLLNFVGDCLRNNCVMYAYIAPGDDPPGLYAHHCYGVMNSDDANIFVRNPHGGERARSVRYDGGTMRPGIQVKEKFYLRAPDFFKYFYTLQFSQF